MVMDPPDPLLALGPKCGYFVTTSLVLPSPSPAPPPPSVQSDAALPTCPKLVPLEVDQLLRLVTPS